MAHPERGTGPEASGEGAVSVNRAARMIIDAERLEAEAESAVWPKTTLMLNEAERLAASAALITDTLNDALPRGHWHLEISQRVGAIKEQDIPPQA